MFKSIFYTLVLSSFMVFSSSCKQNNQRSEMLDALENSGVEIPEELREEAGFSVTDLFFPLAVVLGFGLIGFLAYRKIRRSKASLGYAISDMNEKMSDFKKGDKAYDTMTDEEKKEFKKVNKLFNNNKQN